MSRKKGSAERGLIDRMERLILTISNGFFGLLAKFGIPGLMILFLTYFASPEQKEKIISKWILMEGPMQSGKIWVVAFLSGGIIVFLGQWYYFRKEKELLLNELSRREKEVEKLHKILKARDSKK